MSEEIKKVLTPSEKVQAYREKKRKQGWILYNCIGPKCCIDYMKQAFLEYRRANPKYWENEVKRPDIIKK
jgi:hypothetical protein